MKISELTTQEKSFMLARLMGWRIANLPLPGNVWKRVLVDEKDYDLGLVPYGGGITRVEMELKPTKKLDFYQEANMHLAWRVLSWASDTAADGLDPETANNWIHQIDYLLMDRWRNSTAEEVQTEWLDKVLELAIAAGLVESQP